MNSDCAETDDGSLALAFLSLRFLSASQILFSSNWEAPLLMRQRSSGILVTWPVHLSCVSFNRVCTLCIFAFFRTSVSGILSCHLIFRSFLRQLRWKWLSFLAWRWYTVQVSHAYKRVGSTTALKTFSFVSSLIPIRSQTFVRSLRMLRLPSQSWL